MRSSIPLNRELDAIENLYRGALYSFALAGSSAKAAVNSAEIPSVHTFRWPVPGFADDLIAEGFAQLTHRLTGVFPQQLREALLIRAVSAFEAFLIETVREVFTARRDLFYRDEDVTLPTALVLSQRSISGVWTYVLNKELRSLSSAGLRRIQNYYRQRFDVALEAGPYNWTALSEAVDRRHLLVHRLGQTDAKFRRDYAINARRITVGRTYFAETLQLFRTASRWISGQCEKLVQRPILGHRNVPQLSRLRLAVRPKGRRGRAALLPDFCFTSGEELVRLADIVAQHEKTATHHDLVLIGDADLLEDYKATLESLAVRGDVEICEAKYEKRPKRGQAGLPRGVVEAVRSKLPPGRAPDGFTRRLAEELGVPPSAVASAINYVRGGLSTERLDEVVAWLEVRPRSDRLHIELCEFMGISVAQAKRAVDDGYRVLRAREREDKVQPADADSSTE